jgi:ABC-type microcin C transport system permease subunit YejE
MTLTYVLVGLAAWTVVSVLVGLTLGAILGNSSAADDMMIPQPDRALRKSA